MPKRSNQFQRILAAVHRLYAPQGATITESAMLTSAMGVHREVDILVEVPSKIMSYRIAVEAKDHKRRLDNTAIDEIKGKFSDMPVRDVVIVAHGFTRGAKLRAAACGIRCHTLTSLEADQIGHFAHGTTPVGKPAFTQPERVKWGMYGLDGQSIDRELAHQGTLYNSGGTPLGNPFAFAVR